MRELLYIAGGIVIGTALTFYQVDTPHEQCGIPVVSRKVVTSYVLKPPPAPAPIEHVVVKETVCPQVTKMPEIESKPEATNADERPRRRHRRHRRYWR